jgi:acetylornithine/succinyldiaminopimelate/putrescine aminotransferase
MLIFELDDEFVSLIADEKGASQRVVIALMRNGLLAVPAGPSVIRWLPPLNVSRAEIDEAVLILSRTLAAMAS